MTELAPARNMNFLLNLSKPLLALLAVALGGSIGLLAVGYGQMVEVTTSLLVIILFGLLILSAPLPGFLVWLFGAALLD